MEEAPTRDFLTSFHNLPGITVAEKKHSLKMLFHENFQQILDPEFQEIITIELNASASTHLERVFFIDFLIFTRRIPDLIAEFQRGNEIVVAKISKIIWFFAEAYEKYGADEFVNELLPNLSYNIRLKVLKKISIVGNMREEKVDAIFDALYARYGLFVATQVLTACSVTKIEQVLRNQPVKLWTSQLKVLYKRRSPALIEIYLDERVKHEGNGVLLMPDNEIFKFIAAENPEMFCKFQEKYRFRYCRLGKRTTRKVVRAQKARLLEKPELFVDNLKPQTLVRKLGGDFPLFFTRIFPKIGNSHNWIMNVNRTLLQFCSKRTRFELFRSTYNATYHKKLEENASEFNCGLFNLILDPEEREKYAKLRVESSSQALSEFYKYYKPENCYDLMAKKLKTASEEQKPEIVGILTENCITSGDTAAFLSVCKLVGAQFWRDSKIPGKFLQLINPQVLYRPVPGPRNSDILEKLSKSHWEFIKQVISRDEFRVEKLHVDPTRIFFKYLQFLVAEKLPTRDEMIDFFKSTNWTNSLKDINAQVCPASAQKVILMNFIEIAPLILPADESIEEIDCKLLLAVKNFNKEKGNKKEKIEFLQLNQRLFASLSKTAENHKEDEVLETTLLCDVLEWTICRTDQRPEIPALSHIYWKNFDTLSSFYGIAWFLKYHPETISENISVFLTRFLQPFQYQFYVFYNDCSTRPWKDMKSYSHLQLDTKTVAFFLSKLADPSIEDKRNLLQPLVHLMPPADFLKLAETFIPTCFTVDLAHSYTNYAFQFQRSLLQNLKYLKISASKVFELVMKFYRGDFVRSCVCPLNSLVCRIAENELGPQLAQICALKPVSARKHGYFYVCSLSDQETVFTALEQFTLSQAIASCFNLLRKNPSERAWQALQAKITKLDKNDVSTSLLLVNKPVPAEYKSRFLEAAYTVMEKQKNKFRSVLLDKAQRKTVRGLSLEFFREMLLPTFLVSEKSNRIFAFLLFSGEQQHFDLVFAYLKEFKSEKWNVRDFQQRHNFSKFIQSFFDLYMAEEETNTELIETFLQRLLSVFRPEEIFEDYVLVSLMKLKICKTSADFARELIKFNNHLVERSGQMVIEILSGTVEKNFASFAANNSKNLYEVCFNVVNMKESVSDVLLAMQLLPKSEPSLEEEFQFYRRSLALLNDVDDDAVKLYFAFFFDKDVMLLEETAGSGSG